MYRNKIDYRQQFKKRTTEQFKEQIAEQLTYGTSLKFINEQLEACDIEIISYFLNAPQCKCTELVFNNNQINNDGLIKLANMLGKNTTVTTLKIMGKQDFNAHPVTKFLKPVLKGNKMLTTIEFSLPKNLFSPWVITLLPIFETIPGLINLNLANTNLSIYKEFKPLLQKLLETNKNWISLNLSGNQIDDEILQIITEYKSLESLSLNQCNLNNVSFLPNLLSNNKKLGHLDLGCNFTYDDEVGKIILNELRKNSSLTSVELMNNDIPEYLQQRINAQMEINRESLNINAHFMFHFNNSNTDTNKPDINNAYFSFK